MIYFRMLQKLKVKYIMWNRKKSWCFQHFKYNIFQKILKDNIFKYGFTPPTLN